MGEFRIGRKYAQHSYPDTPRAASAVSQTLASNYAIGAGSDGPQTIPDAPGAQVDWTTIDIPADPPTTNDVPITPVVKGNIEVRGVLSVENTGTDPVDVQIQVQIDGVNQTVPAAEEVTVPASDGEGANGFAVIPYLARVYGLTIGATRNVEILVIASIDGVARLANNSSTLEVVEVPDSTG